MLAPKQRCAHSKLACVQNRLLEPTASLWSRPAQRKGGRRESNSKTFSTTTDSVVLQPASLFDRDGDRRSRRRGLARTLNWRTSVLSALRPTAKHVAPSCFRYRHRFDRVPLAIVLVATRTLRAHALALRVYIVPCRPPPPATRHHLNVEKPRRSFMRKVGIAYVTS